MEFNSFEKENKNNLERRDMDLHELGLDLKTMHGKILDVGAGEGELVEYLRINTDAEIVIGIDPVIKDTPNSKIVTGSAQKIPFENNEFDNVLSYASIPNVVINLYSKEDPEFSLEEMTKFLYRSFKEMLRVTKEGGRISMAPIIFGDQYESQRARTIAIKSALEKINKDGHKYSLEFIERVTDENKEEWDKYRAIIFK